MVVKRYSQSGRKRRRGVYILPSFLTLANMFFGFFALIHALSGKFSTAAYLIMIAAFLDLMDGRIARMTGTQTDFGKQLDSLSDLASFGLVPALVVYLYALEPLGRLGWLLAFFFTACGAIRLARYNVLSVKTGGAFFIGLPIPVAAMNLVLLMLFFPESSHVFPYVVFVNGCAMVSTIPYPTFRELDVKSMRPTYTMILIVFLIFLIAYKPLCSLLVFAVIYFLIGPCLWIRSKFTREKEKEKLLDEI